MEGIYLSRQPKQQRGEVSTRQGRIGPLPQRLLRRERLQVFLAQMAGDEPQVNLGGVEVCVAEERLDHAQVRAPTQQMDRDAVAQEVRVDAEADYAGQPAQEDARHLTIQSVTPLTDEQRPMVRTGQQVAPKREAEDLFLTLRTGPIAKARWASDGST